MINELMKQVWELKQEKENLEREQEELKNKLSAIEEQITGLNDTILNDMLEAETESFEDNETDLVATLFTKVNTGYLDEKAVLNYLKENNLSQYITVKESINKRALNSGLKADKTLNESLSKDNWIGTSTTKYVVVTTKENTEKMFEHINGGK